MRTEWPVGRWRLLKLARHLEKGELGHKTFDLTCVNEGKCNVNGCGIRGCAMGELPIVFPSQWRFDNIWGVLLKHGGRGNTFGDVSCFFGITLSDSARLFGYYMTRPWANGPLLGSASRYDVAASIRQFVPWKDKRISA